MPYVARHVDNIEAEREGRIRRVRLALGLTAFGINHIQMPPAGQGTEHDESATGQEEVYFVLDGGGEMVVDGEVVPLSPEVYVFVPPGTTRQVRAGQDGITYVCIGAIPGRGYTPPGQGG